MTRPRTILFDIDNTLLNPGGAGGHAMSRAFADLFGVDDAFGKIEFSGRTDLFILQSALEQGKVEGSAEDHMGAFVSAYARLLPASLVERDGQVMPGFPQLLDELREAGVQLGLATGNLSEGARLKLEFYELAGYFAGGGFGEVSRERSEVVAVAIREVADGAPPEDIMVIGDTPHDITAALANRAIGVGVATGNFSVDELRESGAHITFEDFSDYKSSAEQLLNFEPGAEYLYSNTNYNLLAETVSRVGGKPFPEWTKEQLFEPLPFGLVKTHVRAPSCAYLTLPATVKPSGVWKSPLSATSRCAGPPVMVSAEPAAAGVRCGHPLAHTAAWFPALSLSRSTSNA